MSNKKLTIGLFGFGCVGQGLTDVLSNSKQFSADIKKICIKNAEKPRTLNSDLFTTNKLELLNDPEINTIVELIDDPLEAYDIIRYALTNGKNVVSANKKVIADNLEELLLLQKENNTSLIYEGSACGGIPIIRTLEEYYDNEELNALSGIFNGSSNYILTKIYKDGSTYSEALKKAQELGFAETDPTLDVEGYDPKYKLIILALHAFGVILKPEDVFNYGINNLTSAEIELYKEKGIAVKLKPELKKITDNRFTAFVLPQLIPENDSLYNINNEHNAVSVEGLFSNEQVFAGKGAGGHPTGSAVLSDISALSYHYKYSYKKYYSGVELIHDNSIVIDLYFSGTSEALNNFFPDENKAEAGNHKFLVTQRSIEWLIQNRNTLNQEGIFIASIQPDAIGEIKKWFDQNRQYTPATF